jgi:hypothetical protein
MRGGCQVRGGRCFGGVVIIVCVSSLSIVRETTRGGVGKGWKNREMVFHE